MAKPSRQKGTPKPLTKAGKPRKQTERSKKQNGRWLDRFLASLRRDACVTTACKIAKVGRTYVYAERKNNKEFAAAWDEAIDTTLDSIEASVMRRAKEGWLEPVWHKGEQCGEVRKFSDTIQIFALRQNRPDKWAQADKFDVRHQGSVVLNVVTGVPTPVPKVDDADA